MIKTQLGFVTDQHKIATKDLDDNYKRVIRIAENQDFNQLIAAIEDLRAAKNKSDNLKSQIDLLNNMDMMEKVVD